MVAADFTLYTNPVTRALHCTANLQKHQQSSGDKKQEEEQDEGEDMIASDMTKYDNPLTKLEMETFEKDLQNETISRDPNNPKNEKKHSPVSKIGPIRPNYGLASNPVSTKPHSTRHSKN